MNFKSQFVMAVLFVPVISWAQESLGLRYDNYAASSSILLNPALVVTDPNPWEVNLVSAGLFAENNYVYLDRQNVFSAWKAFNNENIPDPQALYHNVKSVKAYTHTFVQGPSAFVKVNDMHFGIFTGFRSAGFLHSNDINSGTITFDSIIAGDEVTVPVFNSGILNWTELGFNAGTKIWEQGEGTLSAAVNVKIIGALDGTTYQNKQPFTFVKSEHGQLVSFSDYNAAYAMTTNFGSSAILKPSNYRINGLGVGADAGVVYTIGEAPEYYKWKFGASVVDIGRVHFTRNAGTYELVSGGDISANLNDINNVDDLGEYTNFASSLVYGEQDSSQTGGDFSMWLPTAISVQAERAIGYGFFVNAMAVRRVPLGESAIRRPNTISVTPRFESKWLAVGVPVILFDDHDIHFGTAIRLGPLTVGSDNIASLFHKGELEGTDVYAGLRISPFDLKLGKGGKSNSKSGNHAGWGKQKKVNCPEF